MEMLGYGVWDVGIWGWGCELQMYRKEVCSDMGLGM